jgi:endonuclease/exonuclease/phosphatase family metal-dependent hydrolase
MNMVGITACHAGSSARTQSNSLSLSVPSAKGLFQLEAQKLEASSSLASIVLLPQATASADGLTIAYSFSLASAQDEQILGLSTQPQIENVSVLARTADARVVSCESALSKASQSEQNEKFMTAQCGTERVVLKLKMSPAQADRLAETHLLQALSAGARVPLRSLTDIIELSLGSAAVTLHRNGTSRSFSITDQQKSELLSARRGLTLNAANSSICSGPCSELAGDFQLEHDSAGTLKLTLMNAAVGQKTYRFTGSESVRVASYNVENFWDDVSDNSTPYDDFSASLSNWYSDNMAAKKSARVRDALLAAGLPDVVGLQEIESAENKSRSLEILKQDLAPLGYNYYALGQQADDNPTAVTTAFVSKYPLLENQRIDFLFKDSSLPEEKQKDFIDASRDPQRVTINLLQNKTITLVNSHWKSKRDKSPVGDDMRKSIATLLREHLLGLEKASGRAVNALVLGDFNADYREAPVREGLGLSRSLAEARKNPDALFPLWMTLPASEQGSYPHDSHLQALDNIIINRTLLSSNDLVLAGPLQIVGKNQKGDSLLINGDGLPLRSQLRKYKGSDDLIRTVHFNAGYSDHLPLVAEFRYGSGQNSTAFAFAPAIETQTIDALPNVENTGEACLDTDAQRLSPESLQSAPRGSCVLLEGVALTLQKTGLYNISFVVNNAQESNGPMKVIVTADRAFGANKEWLRSNLQTSEGKTLLRLRGHVGLVEGNLAIFIHDPKTDINLQ